MSCRSTTVVSHGDAIFILENDVFVWKHCLLSIEEWSWALSLVEALSSYRDIIPNIFSYRSKMTLSRHSWGGFFLSKHLLCRGVMMESVSYRRTIVVLSRRYFGDIIIRKHYSSNSLSRQYFIFLEMFSFISKHCLIEVLFLETSSY